MPRNLTHVNFPTVIWWNFNQNIHGISSSA